MLWSYSAELRRASAGNTCKLELERPAPNLQPRFGRYYVCFDGCKKALKRACRPFIGVDGCHLKNQYGGKLLIAVGRDPNDQYLPLAFAVVETETKDSWRWFMTLLLEDIGDATTHRWTFISDQQKGLVQVFEELLGGTEHRFCLRHLYANFKKKFGGGTLMRDTMMATEKATYFEAWEEKMLEMKEVNADAYEWLNAEAVTAKAVDNHAEGEIDPDSVASVLLGDETRLLDQSSSWVSMDKAIQLLAQDLWNENVEKVASEKILDKFTADKDEGAGL